MNYDEILKKIIRRYGAQTDNIRMMQIIESKLKKQTATYADAEKYAQGIGKALTEAFREYLPEALTDGKLYRAAAEVLMQQPMVRASRDIDKVAGAIQAEINENAGLGINPIVPEVNQDQIDGIITGICNAESFDAGKEVLFDQVENFMEGHVDDFVRENADFQYQAGLDPKVIRTAAGKCCKWCSNLAGTYKYEDVKDRGNDVWRRHRNCHCVIEYDPGQKSGKRKTVSGDRSLIDQEKADRIAFAEVEDDTITHLKLYNSDLPNGLPIKGKPNSIVDKLDGSGKVLQRRKHGKDGMATVDYDLTDHGETKKHPTGAHKHIFDYSKGGKPRRLNAEMTEADLTENADIIIKGVNYHEQK